MTFHRQSEATCAHRPHKLSSSSPLETRLWCQRIAPSQWSSTMSQNLASGSMLLPQAAVIRRRRYSSAVSGSSNSLEVVELLGERVRAHDLQRLGEQLVE